ncbi:hypothetical protein GCM10018793_65720 [Streptomyces sulfonofaciens]|uniref:Uncharacterized protein n=1 Tax=Streptomyces sulfonofaciens TaxID=68272 RepID=A0A919GNN4_9ACTN|nr:hypothetical protein GCM10018793_65720 [Streptomyces sulfonofaciens]
MQAGGRECVDAVPVLTAGLARGRDCCGAVGGRAAAEEWAVDRGCGGDTQGAALAASYGHILVERGGLGGFGGVRGGGAEEVGDLARHVSTGFSPWRCTTAPSAALQAVGIRSPPSPDAEAVRTMLPRVCFRCGSAACAPKKQLSTSVLMTSRQSSGLSAQRPALGAQGSGVVAGQ